jgi:hypothetical protein
MSFSAFRPLICRDALAFAYMPVQFLLRRKSLAAALAFVVTFSACHIHNLLVEVHLPIRGT